MPRLVNYSDSSADEEEETSFAFRTAKRYLRDNNITETPLEKRRRRLGPSVPPPSQDAFGTDELRERYCPLCDVRFSSLCDMQLHIRNSHSDIYNQPDLSEEDVQIGGGEPIVLTQTQSLLEGGLLKYEADLSTAQIYDLRGLYNILRPQIKTILERRLREGGNFKFNFTISICFYKIQPDGSTQYNIPVFNTFLLSCHGPSDITFGLKKMYDSFATRIDGFTHLASGWAVKNILTFELTIAEADSYFGSGDFELPELLRHKSSLVCPPVRDDPFCFKRAVYCCEKLQGEILAHGNQRRRVTKSWYLDSIMNDGQVKWNGINFPFDTRQADKFQTLNPRIGICIFHYDDTLELTAAEYNEEVVDDIENDGESDEDDDGTPIESDYTRDQRKDDSNINRQIRARIIPLHICREEREIMIDLLLISTHTGQHYVYIKKLGALLRRRGGYRATTFCRWCLSWFSDSMEHHQSMCTALGYCRTELPKDPILKFKHFNYTQKQAYIIICDLECSLFRLDEEVPDRPSYVNKTQLHQPNGYCYSIIDHNGELVDLVEYTAEDDNENVVKRFLTELIVVSQELKDNVKRFNREAENTVINITDQDEDILCNPYARRSHPCCFCKHPLGNDRVHRHHSHLPPYEYVGLSHSRCNMHGRLTPKFTVYFHNSRKYDGLFILRNATTDIVDDLDVIMGSSEEVIQITINKCLIIRDSNRFFNSSLAKIAANMDINRDFNLVRKHFSQHPDSSVNLLLKKQFYPYSYVDSVVKFAEAALPPKEAFYNDILKEGIDDNDYEHALRVWREFNMATFRDYHTLYLKLDVLILADAIVSLRNQIYNDFSLDLCHYMSLSQLSLDAALKFTGRELELIKDRNMFLFCRRAVLGGMSSCGNIRCHQANNKFLPDYDSSKPTSHILYLDAVNLYGRCLMSKLPTGGYEWCVGMELEYMQARGAEFWGDLDDDGDFGYIVEVDVSIPENLIDSMDKFPPIYTRQNVEYDLLSDYQKQMFDDLNLPATTFKTNRLMATFFPAKNHVVHSKLLKFWLSIGVKLDKLHHAVKFNQEAWLAPYVYYMSEKRKNATTKLKQQQLKDMVNVVFGKTIEEKRKRLNAKIVRSKAEIAKWVGKPNADRIVVINKSTEDEDQDIAIVCLRKESVTLDTLIAVGSTCLGNAKFWMLNFYYNYVAPTFDAHDVLYTDTDSLILCIRNVPDIYEIMQRDGHWFDMSVFDNNHPVFGRFHNPINKKRPGYFKDEFANQVIRRFVVIKPKMYSIEFIKDGLTSTECKAKGVSKSSIKKDCRFDDYVRCLTDNVQTYTESTGIRSFQTKLYTVDVRKTALSAFDCKRWISPCGIMTLAYGNPKIRLYEQEVPIDEEPTEFDAMTDSELVNTLIADL